MRELERKLEVIKKLTGKQNIIINYAACYGGCQLCYLLDGIIEGLTIGRV